jgi:hypothetical protein
MTLKGTRTRKGYLSVQLWRQGVSHPFLLHQLVLLAFVGPPGPGELSRHGRAGVSDNSLANLCYGTPAENQADRIRDNTTNRGEANGHAVLTEDEVVRIKAIFAHGGVTHREVAQQFRVTRRTVGRIVTRKTWRHVA